MKKLSHHIIAILAILMPSNIMAQADNNEPYAVLSKDGSKLTFYYDNQKSLNNGLNIGPNKYNAEENGNAISFSLSKTSWDDKKELITTVEFDNSFADCKTITSTALWFYGCKNLVSIIGITNLNTENVTDMGYMFCGCSSLTFLDLASFRTDNVESMLCMFEGCSNLTNLNLTSFNTKKVKRMGHMFQSCSSLKSLDVRGFKTDSVTSMSRMFTDCSSLKTVDVSNFNTSNVSNMAYMFNGCLNIIKIDLSSFKTDKVTTTEGMFGNCRCLTILDLSGFNTVNITDMSSMFYQCTSLTHIYLNNFNTANATDMRRMFQGCFKLKKIYAGNEWTTTSVNYGDEMFQYCNNLVGGMGTKYNGEHIDYIYARIDQGTSNPGYLTHAKNNVSYAVLNEDSTKLIFYYDDQSSVRNGFKIGPVNNYSYGGGSVAKGIITNGWNRKIEKVKIVEFDASFADCDTLSSTAGWFDGCKELTSIIGISNLKTDYVTDMKFMFSGCSSLTSVDLGGFNTEYLTNMDYMFEGCSNLESLDLSRFKMDKLTSLDHVFMGCASLSSLKLMKGRTDNITKMSGLFYGCSNLTSLDVSGFKTYNVTDMSYMFRDCSGLKSLDVSGFYTGNVTNMCSMFDGCSGLTELNLSGFITDNVTNMNLMFSNCSSLTSLDISGFKTDNVTDMGCMFQLCSSLTCLDVSNFKTSKVTDMRFMFSQCSSLTTLDLSGFYTGNVTSMSFMFQRVQELTCLDLSGFNTEKVKSMTGMFANSFNLKTIYVGGEWSTTNVTEGNEMFKGCYSLLGGMGTKYDDNYIDHAFAHIDEGISNPGYLTRPTTFRLSISALGNGSITYDNNKTRNQSVKYMVEADSSVSMAIIPDEGYCVKNLIVNNKDVTSNISDNCYTISSINTNISIEIEFAKTYTLSVKTSGNGTARFGETSVKGGSNTFTIIEGTSATITMTPDEGNKVKSVTINNEDVTSRIFNNQYTIDSIKGDTYVEVEFEEITYTLTIKATGYGEINYDEAFVRGETSTFSVTEGSSVTVKIIPDEGRYVKSLNVNNEDVTSSITDSIYTINNIYSNIEIEAIFAIVGSVSNGGINYSVVSEDEKTVVLSKGDYGLYINIPSSFSAYNIEWTVTGIERGALDNASELAAIIWNPETKFDGNINNPNLLLYVKSDEYAPNDSVNTIVNNNAKSIILTDAESGNNFYCPQEFTAERITYEHNYSMETGYNTCQGWESIVLPFDVAVVTNNVGTALVPYSLWKYGDSNRPFWLYSMNENGWNAESAIKANTPYIISIPNNENYDAEYNMSGDIVFSASNIKVLASDSLTIAKTGHRNLVPNYQNREKASEIYALNVNNLWDKNTENDIVEGSAFVRGLRQVRPFEAYMTIDSGGAATRSISIFGDGNTTGIMDIPKSKNDDGVVRVYTLSGVLVKQGKKSEALSNLPKGVYVINGEKFVVK